VPPLVFPAMTDTTVGWLTTFITRQQNVCRTNGFRLKDAELSEWQLPMRNLQIFKWKQQNNNKNFDAIAGRMTPMFA